MGSKKQKPRETRIEGVKAEGAIASGLFPAEVLEILGKVGTKQGGTQVRCKVLSGEDTGKIIRRNVYGPIRIGDILTLRETEIEASPIKSRRLQQ